MKKIAIALLAAAAAVLAPAGSSAGAGQDQRTSSERYLWVQPMAPSLRPGAGADFKELFTRPELWQGARGFTHAFFFYEFAILPDSGYLALTEAELRNAVAFLNARGIWIGSEEGAVKDWGGDGRLEADYTKRNIDWIRRLGGELRIIKMDEPLDAGMRILGFSLDQTVEAAVRYVRKVAAYAPGIVIGDIEAYPGSSADVIRQWIEKFAEAYGRDLPFLVLDLDFDGIRRKGLIDVWADDMRMLQEVCRERNIRFGVIFWSSNYLKAEKDLASDADFYDSVMAFGEEWFDKLGAPAITVLQSWSAYPRRNLPDDDGRSFMQLVRDFGNTYIAPSRRLR